MGNISFTPHNSQIIRDIDPTRAANAAITNGNKYGNVYLAPLGTGDDDWIRLNAVLNACASKYPLYLLAGNWYCKSVQYIPSNTILIGNPGVTIISSLTGTGVGEPTNSILMAKDITTPILTTSLSSAAYTNDITININSSTGLTVGMYIQIVDSVGSNQSCVGRKVTNISGSGPFILSIDEPLPRDLLVGCTVFTYNPPSNIKIYGNGMEITGSGDRAFEFVGGRNCIFSDVIIRNHTLDGPVVSYDIPSQDCILEKLKIDIPIGAKSDPAIFIESSERCKVLNSTIRIFASGGFSAILPTCSYNLVIDGCNIIGNNGSSLGIYIYNAQNTIEAACKNIIISNNNISRCQRGIEITRYAKRIAISNCEITRCSFSIVSENNSQQITINNCSTYLSSIAGTVIIDGYATITGHISDSDVNGISSRGSSTVVINGFELFRNAAPIGGANWIGLDSQNTATLIASNGFIDGYETQHGVNLYNTSIIMLENIKFKTEYDIYIRSGSAGQCWINNNLINATSITDVPGSSLNIGTLALTDGYVNFAFRGASAASKCLIQRVTPGGTTGDLSYVPTTGNIRVNSTSATDTSTVDIKVLS